MAEAAAARLNLFGIRHHGPGSARSLLTALAALDPAIVLIEGPPDANDIIRFAASSAMVPPVAMLVHGQDDPANASFYPFGIYSPEWQAMRWAMAGGRPVRFIDLPAANRLALRTAAEQGANAPTIFAAIETAMTELRAHVDTLLVFSAADKRIEDQREAHMRLAIA